MVRNANSNDFWNNLNFLCVSDKDMKLNSHVL